MATNKHATIRYHELDRCFSNQGRLFFIDDLVDACNHALYEYTGIKEGVKKRQVFDDIKFMESDQGWSIPLGRIREGKKVYYRYSEKSFSISSKGINPSEAEQLNETLSILRRFKGMPQFEWIEEIQVRLEDTFKLKGDNVSIVGFEQNPYLKGLEKFTALFNAIQNKQALYIEYKGFKQKESSSFIFHSWYLKQYNNRWFLFGTKEGLKSITNLAVDRIISFKNSSESYIENKTDFEEFFEDVVGVSVDPKKEKVNVLINISLELWPYIESKPIHGSQTIRERTEEFVQIELVGIQETHELISLLFSYMDGMEIIAPLALRNKFMTLSKAIFEKYK